MLSFPILSVLLLASCQQVLAASCSNFTVTTDYSDLTYSSIARTFIISAGVNCPATQNCTLPIGGYITYGRTLNITTDSEDSLFETISSAVDMPFNKTMTYPVATAYGPWTVANGTAAYVGFTPYTRCATGRLSGCGEDDLEGVIVEACTLATIPNTDTLNGVVGQITTDPETAEGLTCNPANTTEAKNGNYTGSSACRDATSSGGDTGAASVFGFSVLLLSSCLLVAFIGF